MNPVQLLEHFDRISEAPDVVARLRRFILDLAVRGKLVEQYPDDEPAAELLRQIQVTKRGKILAAPEAPPYLIPLSWKWTQLGMIAEKLTDGSHNPPRNAETGFPMLSSKNILDGEISFSNPTRYLSDEDFAVEDARTRIEPEDVLLTIVGSIGRSAVVSNTAPQFALQRSVAVIRSRLNPRFLSLLLRSPSAQDFFEEHGKGTAQKGIYLGKLSALPVALPPLAEQHRIVVKVDELMALCDQLEAAKKEREARCDQLVAASLHRIDTAPAAADESASEAPGAIPLRDAARFHLDHLPRLTTRPEHIKQLRQTILNLAVRGRLVPQDPNDEPIVSNLTGQDADEERPFGLPQSWRWQCISEISVLVTDGEHATPTRVPEHQVPLVTAKNVRDGEMDYTTTDWVSFDTAEKAWRRCRPLVSDILLVCVGATTGRLCVLREPKDMVLVRSVALIRPSEIANVDYLAMAIRSPLGQSQIWGSVKVTAQPCLYINRINALAFPVPPLAEQQRIVAKVDELMALCNQLEAQLITTQTNSRRLLEAVLHEALAPAMEQAA